MSEAEPLRVEAKYDGPEATIIVEGDLDIRSAGDLLACVSRSARKTDPGSIDHDRRPWAHLHRFDGPRSLASCSCCRS